MANEGVAAEQGAGTEEVRDARTDWSALFVTLIVPGLLIAGLLHALRDVRWSGSTESLDWIDGVVVLIPLEFVRVIMLAILRDTYGDYRNPRHAIGLFLVSVVALIVMLLVLGALTLGEDFLRALIEPHLWALALPPLAILTLDGMINLAFFRGDPNRVAAQFDAMAADARDWFDLFVYPLPLIVGAACLLLALGKSVGVAWLAGLPAPSFGLLRQVCVGYSIVYFVGKTVLLAHAQTAHFLRGGERLMARDWIRWVGGDDAEKRAAARAQEAQDQRRRLRALNGEPFAPRESAKAPRRKRK